MTDRCVVFIKDGITGAAVTTRECNYSDPAVAARIYCAGGDTWVTIKARWKSAKSRNARTEAGCLRSKSSFREAEEKGPLRRSDSQKVAEMYKC